MTASSTMVSRSPAHVPALDARTLGRPVHLLERFSEQLREDFAEQLRTSMNLRYRARFDVAEVHLKCMPGPLPEAGWMDFGEGDEALHCAIDRDLVLSVMAYRYGLRAALSANGEAPRETATEERLTAQLAARFGGILAARIETGIGTRLPAESPTLPEPTRPAVPPTGAWTIEARVVEHAHGINGTVRFALGDARMAMIWQALAPLRGKPTPHAEQATPLATRLGFRLVARLLHKDIALGDLAEMRVGDVIPISLGATDVLIDDARLFTAAVAEHQGKLCLTSFADAD